MKNWTFALTILLCIALIAVGALVYKLTDAKKIALAAQAELQATIATLQQERDTAQTHIRELEALLTDTQTMLQDAIDEKDGLSDDLENEKNKNEEFENQIKKIGSTVGTLDKLAKTDPELLIKYSKVFFLNENYMPEKLVTIDKDFLSNPEVPRFIHANVAPFLKEMLEDAADDEVTLKVVSAFRSFDEQKDLKGAYTVAYGTGANTFSADQGYSEHQLGTTLDFTTTDLGGGLNGFDSTPAYAWLEKHAYKYGFILSYPKDNAYYIYEPWHWRFVGTELARELRNTGKHFYDLDQRTIDTYLISLFDE